MNPPNNSNVAPVQDPAPVVVPEPVVQPPVVVPSPPVVVEEPSRLVLLEAQLNESTATIATLRSMLEQAKAELAKKQTPEERTLAELASLKTQLQGVEDQLKAERVARVEEARVASLHVYRERRLREFTEAGSKLRPDRIGGNSETEIENSIAQEQAFWNEVAAAAAAQTAQTQVTTPAVPAAPVATVAVPVPVAAPLPSAFPTPVAQVPIAVPDIIDAIPQLTTEEAVRSGEYAKQRGHVLAGLRANAPSLPAGRPFANMPRLPVGLPTPPVAAPRQVLQQQPAVATTVVPRTPAMPPMPSTVVPAVPPMAQPAPAFDMAAAQAAARDAANRALGNPGAVRAAVTSGGIMEHAEYRAVPSEGRVTEGAPHPMDRSAA